VKGEHCSPRPRSLETKAEKPQLLAFDLRHLHPVPAVRHAQEGGEDRLHRRLLVTEAGDDLGSATFPFEGALEQLPPGSGSMRSLVREEVVRTLMRWRTGSLRCASDAYRSSARQAIAAG
jgi:hypothetical protein